MVLQRYALRFTISDATLDSLKLPRSTSQPKPDANQEEMEHKITSPASDSETSEPLHKPEPAVSDQMPTKPKAMETDIDQQETSVSVSSSSLTPISPLTPVTNSDNVVPPQLLQLDPEPQPKPTESPTTHQQQPTTEDAKPQIKHTPPQIAQVQPHTTPPVHTLPSPPSVSPRPVPLLAAKPYCQPRSTQAGHKPVKVRAPYQSYESASSDTSLFH